jgi:hypothetical protein
MTYDSFFVELKRLFNKAKGEGWIAVNKAKSIRLAYPNYDQAEKVLSPLEFVYLFLTGCTCDRFESWKQFTSDFGMAIQTARDIELATSGLFADTPQQKQARADLLETLGLTEVSLWEPPFITSNP